MQADALNEKINGFVEIIATYEKVGRGDCPNCEHAKSMLEGYQDDLRRLEELHSKEEGFANVVQEVEGGNVDLGAGSGVLQTPSQAVLSTSVR